MNRRITFLCLLALLHIPNSHAQNIVSRYLTQTVDTSYAGVERPLSLQRLLYPIEHQNKRDYGFDVPTISGFIKHDTFWDSVQVFGSGQRQLLLYPEAPRFDACCAVINKKGSFNMLNIESRIRAEAQGPTLWDAQTYAVYECDCRGNDTIALINIFRTNHSFLLFAWDHSSLLIGRYYHPLTLPDYQCEPATVSYNSGMPIEPYTLAPQIRYSKNGNSFSFTAAAMAHAYRPQIGPPLENGEVPLNNIYGLRAIVPNVYAGAYVDIHGHHIGAGIDVFRLVPRIVTDENIRHTESLWSCLLNVFAVYNHEKFQLKLRGLYAQNGFSYTMISGYAVHSIDPATDKRTYTNLQCVSLWADAAIVGSCEPGIFMGITKNIGACKSIDSRYVYALGRDKIDYVARISPRLRCYLPPFILGLEFEFTRAAFGEPDYRGRVRNAQPVNNIRFLGATYYCF